MATDLIGRARIDHAGGEPIGDPKPLFDFAQRQNAARPPSNLTTTGLPEADDRPGSGSIELFMADAARLKSRESASTTRLLCKINRLSHIRQPAAHNAG